MQKLILKCGLAPGDIVMLTAAVRDLHRCYPGRFQTDVRTFSPAVWEHNPNITEIPDADPEAREIDCSYPLINTANRLPHHCLNGFVHFLSQQLGLPVALTETRGDIHLTQQEKLWFSQVHELTGSDTPFWIIDAGGKYDVTIKWWDPQRYQEVVNLFAGRIQFVQVGRHGHYHPKLEGVIDLRGQTDLRQLIRLVYHAQGILCPVTSLMHLAAAVPVKHPRTGPRACVVVAGGREPAHWESYPGQQYIHLNGALDCCRQGGCWKDRAFRLRDRDRRDKNEHLCSNVVGDLPRCMDLIRVEDVVRRIETYFEGGRLKYLSAGQRRSSARAVMATRHNEFDKQPLNLHSAGMALDRYISNLSDYPGGFTGRGIVLCAGGIRYFTNAWVCIRMLRSLGCNLPIQVWHRGKGELDARMKDLLASFNVQCVDASVLRRRHHVRLLHGWGLKPYAILHCPFREVLFLDADNVPVNNPEFLFNTLEFRSTGAIFWPDYPASRRGKTAQIWHSCGMRQPKEPEFESGQILVDKERCWRALQLTMWFNENCDFYYRYVHGDKETFHLAFQKLQQPYHLVRTPIHTLEGTMCQHDLQGTRLFQHRNRDKWDYLGCNRHIADFWLERQCLAYVAELKQKWDADLNGKFRKHLNHATRATWRRRNTPPPSIQAVMISCRKRERLREETLNSLQQTDWGRRPVLIQVDPQRTKNPKESQTNCTFAALQAGFVTGADYLLFLEDDLQFNRHLWHNLQFWPPLRNRSLGLGGLYNPGLRELACDAATHSRIISANCIFGSQAFLLSRKTLNYVLKNWNRVKGMQDIRISRLAGRLGVPILYHAPSLVQHVGTESVSGGWFHQAGDFDPDWKANILTARGKTLKLASYLA